MHKNTGTSEAVILVKSANQLSSKYDESICCVGITSHGEWVRLYPVAFHKLKDAQQFGRWSRISFSWQMPDGDPRPESRRIDPQSVDIIGELPQNERHNFISRLEMKGPNSLSSIKAQGKSLAILRPKKARFSVERKSDAKIVEEQQAHDAFVRQKKQSDSKTFMPIIKPCPYAFKYTYTVDDGEHEAMYQDGEISTSFSNWSKSYGEEQTLARITKMYAEEYPKKGMAFVMGACSPSLLHPNLYPSTWFINAVISMDELYQMASRHPDLSEHCFNLVV